MNWKILIRTIIVARGCQNVQKMRLKNRYLQNYLIDGAEIWIFYTRNQGEQLWFPKIFSKLHATPGRWHQTPENGQNIQSVNFATILENICELDLAQKTLHSVK